MSPTSKLVRAAAAVALVGAVLVPAASAQAHNVASGNNAAVKRIFVIMLENHSQSHHSTDSTNFALYSQSAVPTTRTASTDLTSTCFGPR